MPFWIRLFIYKIKYNNIKINYTVEITNNGKFIYENNCFISRFTNIKINKNGLLKLSEKVFLGRNIEINADNIKIGFDTSIQDRCILLGNIKIGSGVIIAPNVFISSGRHYFTIDPYLSIREQDIIGINTKKHDKIIINDDCWIGINCVIMPGVVIGKGCIIGSGTVVTKSIEPYSVCVGSPAKIIKKRLNFIPVKSLSPLNKESLPYFYSGFKYLYNGHIRKVFVNETCCFFSLNLDSSRKIKVVFFNHSSRIISIKSENNLFSLTKNKNEIYIDTTATMLEKNGLLLNIENFDGVLNQLEVISVDVI